MFYLRGTIPARAGEPDHPKILTELARDYPRSRGGTHYSAVSLGDAAVADVG